MNNMYCWVRLRNSLTHTKRGRPEIYARQHKYTAVWDSVHANYDPVDVLYPYRTLQYIISMIEPYHILLSWFSLLIVLYTFYK